MEIFSEDTLEGCSSLCSRGLSHLLNTIDDPLHPLEHHRGRRNNQPE